MKDDSTVGHVACKKSCVLWYFIDNDIVKSLLKVNKEMAFFISLAVANSLVANSIVL